MFKDHSHILPVPRVTAMATQRLKRRGRRLGPCRKTFIALFLAVPALLAQTACSKDGRIIYEPDPKDRPGTSPLITVLYPPDGLGDRSYNDLICQGVEEAAIQYGLRTQHLSPLTYEGGRISLASEIALMRAATDNVRRLLIIAGTVYDGDVRRSCASLEAFPCADLLYLGTPAPLSGKGATLYISCYGGMYAAGAIAPVAASEVLLVGANPGNLSVSEAMRGFTDGFQTKYIEGGDNKRLVTCYLAEEAEDGFSIADSTALRIMREPEEEWESFDQLLVPVCQGAANTFNRLCELIGGYYYVGIDCPQASSSSPFSVVRHIDRAVIRCISQWLSEEGMPKHQRLGMADGYTEVMLHPYSPAMQKAFREMLPEEIWGTIRAEAIRKEAEYEK